MGNLHYWLSSDIEIIADGMKPNCCHWLYNENNSASFTNVIRAT